MPKPFTPFDDDNQTLAIRVQDRIREAILTHALEPGARIDQNQVAEALKVSLAPVREAMKGLEAEGLVTILPRRGAFVAEISVTDMDELYAARALIEGETIFRAVPELSERDLANLQHIIDRMKQATDNNDVGTYIALNRDFHLGIYHALNNAYLLQVIHNLWKRSEMYRYRYMYSGHDHERVHQEHQAILDACRKRAPLLAREAATMHILGTQQELHDQLLQMEIAPSDGAALTDLSLPRKG